MQQAQIQSGLRLDQTMLKQMKLLQPKFTIFQGGFQICNHMVNFSIVSLYKNINLSYQFINMSNKKILRKRSQSPKHKIHSEQSINQPPTTQSYTISLGNGETLRIPSKINNRFSILRNFQENIARRRFSTTVQNSPSNLHQKSREKSSQNSYHKFFSPYTHQNSFVKKIKTINSSEILKTPQNNQKQMEEAKNAYRSKDIPKALQLFRALLKQHPKSAQIPYYIGSCYLNQKKYEKSIFYFNNCLSLNPMYDRNVYLYIAVNFKNLQKYKNAIKILDQGIQKFGNFEQGLFYKGKILIKLGDLIQSNKAFESCHQINKKNTLSLVFLSQNLRSLGKPNEALRKIDLALQITKASGKNVKFRNRKLQNAVSNNKKEDQTNKFNKESEIPNYLASIYLKKITILTDLGRNKEVEELFKSLQSSKQNEEIIRYMWNNPQFLFNRAKLMFCRRNFTQAKLLLENILSINSSMQNTISSVKLLIRINIQQKDFFQGEHNVSRAQNVFNIEEAIIFDQKMIIQGVNDLMKRKFEDAKIKFEKTHKRIGAINDKNVPKRIKLSNQLIQSNQFLAENFYPYYAYTLFVLDDYKKSFKTYETILSISSNLKNELYNKFICEGFLLSKQFKYEEARQKFDMAHSFCPRKIQPIFFNCINFVQKIKREKINEPQQLNTERYKYILQNIQKGKQVAPKCSLFYFYSSLVHLFVGNPSLLLINHAIDTNQQAVSEYYFIKSLTLSLLGKEPQALDMINKAISMDQSIPEFYKQRSKHLFVLQRYQQAADDVRKVLSMTDTEDQEARLLLCFYSYLSGQYNEAYDTITDILKNSDNSTEQRFGQFKQAIELHLGYFSRIPIVGPMLQSIVNGTKLSQDYIGEFQNFIKEKLQYGEFTTYFYHMMVGCYYIYDDESQKAMPHLYQALEEIQVLLAESILENERERTARQIQKKVKSQIMLNEVKFNIVICSIININGDAGLDDTINLIELFLKEIESNDIIKALKSILNILHRHKEELSKQKSQQSVQKQKQAQEICVFEQYDKLSDQFPMIKFPIGSSILITKLLFFYPPKMKFSIAPQFDKNFLYNFDFQKVDSKLSPPWLKVNSEQQFIFTDQMCNQSVQISVTEMNKSRDKGNRGDFGKGSRSRYEQAQEFEQPVKNRKELRQLFKLDQEVEARLKKIIVRPKSEKTSNINID